MTTPDPTPPGATPASQNQQKPAQQLPPELKHLMREQHGKRERSAGDVEIFGLTLERAAMVAHRTHSAFRILDAAEILSEVCLDEPELFDVPIDDPVLAPLEELSESVRPVLDLARSLHGQLVQFAPLLERVKQVLREHPVLTRERRALTTRQLIAVYLVRAERTKASSRIEPMEIEAMLKLLGEIPEAEAPPSASAFREVLKKVRGQLAEGGATKAIKRKNKAGQSVAGKVRGELLTELEGAAKRRANKKNR